MRANERRDFFRKDLSVLYLPYYNALCAVLGPEWQPYAGFRTFDAQNGLYAQGRVINPIGLQYRITNAKGGESPHNYGSGTDWTWFDGEHLDWLSEEDPRWDAYVFAVRKVGLKAGQDFGDVDHNELKISCGWPHVYLAYTQGGMTAAQAHIKINLVAGADIPGKIDPVR